MKPQNLEDIEDPYNIPDRSWFGRNDHYYLSEEEYKALEELYHINDLHILEEDECKANNDHSSDEIDLAGMDFPFTDLEDSEN